MSRREKELGRRFHNDLVNEAWIKRVSGNLLFTYTYQMTRNGRIRKQQVNEALVPLTIIEYFWTNYEIQAEILDDLHDILLDTFEKVIDGKILKGSDTPVFHFEFNLPEGHAAETEEEQEEESILQTFGSYCFDNE